MGEEQLFVMVVDMGWKSQKRRSPAHALHQSIMQADNNASSTVSAAEPEAPDKTDKTDSAEGMGGAVGADGAPKTCH